MESTSQDNVLVGPSQPPRGRVEISLEVTAMAVVLPVPSITFYPDGAQLSAPTSGNSGDGSSSEP